MTGAHLLVFVMTLLQASPSSSPEEALNTFHARIAAIKARHADAGPADEPQQVIARLRELDAVVSESVGDLMATRPTPPVEASARAQMRQVSAVNTAALKALIPAEGWFLKSRYGEETARNAFLILQHSPDEAFQAAMLPVLEKLVPAGEVRGPDFALLYDRVQMRAGKPQRYGSQGECLGGTWGFHEIEDPQAVDDRRRAIGFTQTLKEYAPMIGVGDPC